MADSCDESVDCMNPTCLANLVTRRGPDDGARLEVEDCASSVVRTPDSDGVS